MSEELRELHQKKQALLDRIEAERVKREIAELERQLAARTFWQKLQERLGR